MMEECRGKSSYNDKIQILNFGTHNFGNKESQGRYVMLEVFKILKQYEGVNGDCFFRIQSKNTRGHSTKLY